MKNALLPILLVICGITSADTYSTIIHARITPTNRVVTSIPNWAQSDSAPSTDPSVVSNISSRVTSNIVTKAYVEGLGVEMGKIDAIYTNGVEVVLSNKIANLVIPQPPAVSYPVTDVQTNGVSALDGTVAKIVIPTGMTTNAVSGIITNHVDSGYLCTVAAAKGMTNGLQKTFNTGTNLSFSYEGTDFYSWSCRDIEGMYFYTTTTNSSSETIDVYSEPKIGYRYDGVINGTTIEVKYWADTLICDRSSGSDVIAEKVLILNNTFDGYTKTEIAGNTVTNGGAVECVRNDKSFVRYYEGENKLKHGGVEVTANEVGALGQNDMAASANSLLTENDTHYIVWNEDGWCVQPGNGYSFYLVDSYSKSETYDSEFINNNFANKDSTETAIANLSATSATHTAQIDQWENYWRGDRVRLSVTNYYGNTSGELPRLRIEEFDHSTTNVVDNVQVISNFFHTVWDETDRQTNYMAQTDAKLVTISNSVMESAWRQTNLQLANKAPRAWQSVTSAGEDAPPNMVWHTAPNTVFAGGTEYAHVAVGEGSICVLTDRGAPVYTDGAEGQFRFQDQTGENYFGFDVRSSYKIGCRTDGISVDPAQHIVSLTYDLTSATDPSILYSTNLVDWADAEVEWEQNPPAGTKVCYINVGNQPKGFFQAEMRYTGGSKFLTNMQADLMGGIAASNQTLNIVQSVEPYIVSNQVMWRVKQ